MYINLCIRIYLSIYIYKYLIWIYSHMYMLASISPSLCFCLALSSISSHTHTPATSAGDFWQFQWGTALTRKTPPDHMFFQQNTSTRCSKIHYVFSEAFPAKCFLHFAGNALLNTLCILCIMYFLHKYVQNTQCTLCILVRKHFAKRFLTMGSFLGISDDIFAPYWVATISRLLELICLFCKRAL